MKKRLVALLCFSTSVMAEKMPDSAYSVGLGMSVNDASFNKQWVNAVGYSEIYSAQSGQLL